MIKNFITLLRRYTTSSLLNVVGMSVAFAAIYLIKEACEMLDDFVDTFEDFADCNVDENQTWHDAIEEVLEEVGKNGRKTDC